MIMLARWGTIVLMSCALPAVAPAQTPRTAVTSVPQVARAAREIARGVVLSAADIESAVEGDTLVGWMTRRLITAGEPLRAPAVVPPQLVKSGELVDVVYQRDGVLIAMRGRATRSAALGERITVRLDNQRKLEATVVAAGRARVN